jgi:hypothetical protein
MVISGIPGAIMSSNCRAAVVRLSVSVTDCLSLTVQKCSTEFHTDSEDLPTDIHQSGPTNNKLTPSPLVRKRTIPTDRPPLVSEIQCQLLWLEGVAWSVRRIPDGR